ncbi:hypothetical protein ACP70R_020274 [Stipagrostis hirtigluma subsp. patula]
MAPASRRGQHDSQYDSPHASVKVVATEESIEDANNKLLILYSFLETVSPTKTSLQRKLQQLSAELGNASDRRTEMKLKAERAPLAQDMLKLGRTEAKVVAKAREYYKAVIAVGGVPEAPPGRYLPALKH